MQRKVVVSELQTPYACWHKIVFILQETCKKTEFKILYYVEMRGWDQNDHF